MAVPNLNQEALAALRLSLIPHVGPQMHARLIAHFGSAAQVLAAPLSVLREVDGVGSSLAAAIARSDEQDVEAEIIRCRENGIEIIPLDSDKYPKYLREIYDPPPILYSRGTTLPQDALSIAIVGTRHATSYGKTQAARLASSLARSGLTIISGMARGIDAAAHYGALEAGGRTVAVLPGGITNVYPREHQALAFDITQQGALLSESPCQHPISRGSFPRRNRIITGLSLGVIVVEAGERSGALVSARTPWNKGVRYLPSRAPWTVAFLEVVTVCSAMVPNSWKLPGTCSRNLAPSLRRLPWNPVSSSTTRPNYR